MPNPSLAAALLIASIGVAVYADPQRAAAPAAGAKSAKRVPFEVGETLTYDVSWSSYLTAGTAIAMVKERRPSDNTIAYYVVAEGRPTPLLASFYSLYYKLDTLIDASTLLPQRASTYTEEGRRHKYKIVRFDRRTQNASFEVQSTTTAKSSVKTPPNVQDALSAFYSLRMISLRPGNRVTVPVFDDGRNYRMQVQVEASERVRTPLGEMTAWRLKPTIVDEQGLPAGQNLAVWISDDARRLPVKMQAQLPVGTFNLTLREVK